MCFIVCYLPKNTFPKSQRDNDIDFYSEATTSTISMDNLSFDAILLTVALQCDEADKKRFIHSRYQKRFYRLLSRVECQRRLQRIPRSALLDPKESPWRRVLDSRNDQALITLTGFDFNSFNEILETFSVYYNSYTPFTQSGSIEMLDRTVKKGRPRLMSASDGLGLVLVWTRTRGSTSVLQLIFGMTQSSTSEYLSFCTHLLIVVLQQIDGARVRRPTDEEIHSFKDAVKSRHPRLDGVWCTMDGLKLMLECASTEDEQNRYYNGWTCDHYIGAVLVFCPNGMIPICCYNVPGTVHDSSIAVVGNVYKKLEEVYNRSGGICVCDSAFSRSNYPFIIKSGKPTVEMNINELNILEEATSMRQSAEWGMRAFQCSFPRVKDRIPFEYKGQRKLMMKLLILLYNLRTKKVGINQILNVYMPSLDRNVNELYINH